MHVRAIFAALKITPTPTSAKILQEDLPPGVPDTHPDTRTPGHRTRGHPDGVSKAITNPVSD